MKWKTLVLAFVAVFAITLMTTDSYAQKRSSSGSKYSSGSKSSYKPPTSSSRPPSSSPSSKYSSGSTKPPVVTPPSSPSSKYSSGSTKPPANNTPPVTQSNSSPSSKYSSGSTKPPATNTPSKYSSGTPPPSSSTTSSGNPTSKKPTNSGSSTKAQENKQAASQRSYVETKQATAPPRTSYTTGSGQTVKVRTNSPVTESIRSKPSSYYTPTQRTQRTEVHIHNHGYSHPTSWYYSQPTYYVGGGYSSSFWWMMMEWNAERRARWLYHNQHTIEQAAYERGMRDQAVAEELAKLKAQNVSVNPDYVDPEFKENPDLMYSQDYIEAAYNPTVAPSTGMSFLGWVIGILIIGGVVIFVLTQVRFGR